MVKYRDGDILKWPWSIQNPVSYNIDTEISAPYPTSWHKRIYSQAFSEDYKRNAGMQDNRIQYNESHIHMVMMIPPKYAVSDVIKKIKGVTSVNLRKKFDWLKKVYWKEGVVWSPGYFVSIIGIDEKEK